MADFRLGSLNRFASIVGYEICTIRSIAAQVQGLYQPLRIQKQRYGYPVFDSDGRPVYRYVDAPKPLLKKLQKRINSRILRRFSLHPNIMGGVKGKDNILNALQHKGHSHLFLTDIRNFFPSVSHRQVYTTLIGLGLSADVSRLITRITTLNGSVPQGAPTSTSITNLVLKPLDLELLQLASRLKGTYTRFVDDITISAPHGFRSSSQEIVSAIRNQGYAINRMKTRYQRGRAKEVTGVYVGNNFIEPLTRHLHKLEDHSLDARTRIGIKAYIDRILKA